MDNVLIVVDDLEAAKTFFIELGLKLEGETTLARLPDTQTQEAL
jgi:catechol 2,3-dioxygenase-like lactoylglutathione lyase family enzyme